MEHHESTELQALKQRFPNRFKKPQIHPTAFIAPGAQVHGDVTLGEESSIWFNSVLRGDVHRIEIGARSNIQDLSMVHVSHKIAPTIIGNNVTVGHQCILHSCEIADNVLVGMGTRILDRVQIGQYVLIGAGSLITEGKIIPSGSKIMGSPAKIVGEVSDKERELIDHLATQYVAVSRTYLCS